MNTSKASGGTTRATQPESFCHQSDTPPASQQHRHTMILTVMLDLITPPTTAPVTLPNAISLWATPPNFDILTCQDQTEKEIGEEPEKEEEGEKKERRELKRLIAELKQERRRRKRTKVEERDGDVGRGERRKQTSQGCGEGAEPLPRSPWSLLLLSSQYSFQLGNKITELKLEMNTEVELFSKHVHASVCCQPFNTGFYLKCWHPGQIIIKRTIYRLQQQRTIPKKSSSPDNLLWKSVSYYPALTKYCTFK